MDINSVFLMLKCPEEQNAFFAMYIGKCLKYHFPQKLLFAIFNSSVISNTSGKKVLKFVKLFSIFTSV